MSEEQTDQTENTVDQTETTANVSRETNSKPDGYEPVDLSDLPPEKQKEIENRVNYLYRQVKDNSRTVHEYRSLAQQQAQAIDDLMNGMGKVVDHLETRTVDENIAILQQKMNDAFEAGDNKAYIDVQSQLLDLKAQKIAAQNKPKVQPQKHQQTNRNPTPNEIANNALLDGEISDQDIQILDGWQSEIQNGSSVRPWAQESHPLYPQAYNEMLLVFTNPVFQNLGFDQKLSEIDRRMGVQPRANGQTVMGGRLTSAPKRQKITLSPAAERIAVKTKFGGPKAKSDAEHIEAYRKQIEQVRSAKGARQ